MAIPGVGPVTATFKAAVDGGFAAQRLESLPKSGPDGPSRLAATKACIRRQASLAREPRARLLVRRDATRRCLR